MPSSYRIGNFRRRNRTGGSSSVVAVEEEGFSSSSSRPSSSSGGSGTGLKRRHRIERRRRTRISDEESSILRSVFDLRREKRLQSEAFDTHGFEGDTLAFWNVTEWTPRIVTSLRKLFEKDSRNFSSVKFYNCCASSGSFDDAEDGGASSFSSLSCFAEILETILENGSAVDSLVVKGGRRREQEDGSSSSLSESSSTTTTGFVLLSAIRKGLRKKNSSGVSADSPKTVKLLNLNFASFSSAATGSVRDDADDDDEWSGLIGSSSPVRFLDLSGSRFSSFAVRGLCRALRQQQRRQQPQPQRTTTATDDSFSLSSLRLSRCGLEDASLSDLIRSVPQDLTELDLSQNYLGENDSVDALKALANLLRNPSVSSLASLDLSHQLQPPRRRRREEEEGSSGSGAEEEEREEERRMRQQDYAAAFDDVLTALSVNRTVRSIDVSNNHGLFSDSNAVRALSDCLTNNPELRHADVSGCGVSNEGIRFLARTCFPRCKKLRSFVLFNQDDHHHHRIDSLLDEETIRAIEEGLGYSETIDNLGDIPSALVVAAEDEEDDSTTTTNNDDENNNRLKRIRYLLNSNRAGCLRAFRAATSAGDGGNDGARSVSSPLPISVWPLLLERANDSRVEYHYCDEPMMSDNNDHDNNDDGGSDREEGRRNDSAVAAGNNGGGIVEDNIDDGDTNQNCINDDNGGGSSCCPVRDAADVHHQCRKEEEEEEDNRVQQLKQKQTETLQQQRPFFVGVVNEARASVLFRLIREGPLLPIVS